MKSARLRSASQGFTLIEMVITLALVGVIALVSLPLYEVTATRFKEAELRQALRTIRSGLDAYKAAVDAGLLTRIAGESGFPPSLDVLTQALDVTGKSDSGFGSLETPKRIVILRQVPRDPFFPNADVPAAQTWNMRSYGSKSDDPQPGQDVFDVSSKSARVGLDGTTYNTW